MKTPEQRAVDLYSQTPKSPIGCTQCVGPRDGEPVCLCSMQDVVIVDNNYYRIFPVDGYKCELLGPIDSDWTKVRSERLAKYLAKQQVKVSQIFKGAFND